MAAADDSEVFAIERPFNWGILTISDSDSQGVPELSPGSSFATSSNALAIAVRHAQDVDFENLDLGPNDTIPPVTVSVRMGPGNHETPDFSCVLDLPSGKLLVGDADHEDFLTLPPGEYTMAVRLGDAHSPEAVHVRWSRARQ